MEFGGRGDAEECDEGVCRAGDGGVEGECA